MYIQASKLQGIFNTKEYKRLTDFHWKRPIYNFSIESDPDIIHACDLWQSFCWNLYLLKIDLILISLLYLIWTKIKHLLYWKIQFPEESISYPLLSTYFGRPYIQFFQHLVLQYTVSFKLIRHSLLIGYLYHCRECQGQL